MKDQLRLLVLQAISRLQSDGLLPPDTNAAFVIERTRNRDHGDFACNAAMLLAKAARRKPRELAEALVAALPQSSEIARIDARIAELQRVRIAEPETAPEPMEADAQESTRRAHSS